MPHSMAYGGEWNGRKEQKFNNVLHGLASHLHGNWYCIAYGNGRFVGNSNVFIFCIGKTYSFILQRNFSLDESVPRIKK